jgi:hypothetical protein
MDAKKQGLVRREGHHSVEDTVCLRLCMMRKDAGRRSNIIRYCGHSCIQKVTGQRPQNVFDGAGKYQTSYTCTRCKFGRFE